MHVGTPRRIHYAWIVFGATFVILLASAGLRAAPGVLIDPLNREFGWSKADIGLAVSVNVLFFGFMGPFAAALMARFGLRSVVSTALGLIGAGYLLSSHMTARWHMMATWGVIVGLGAGCMASVLAATVAKRWFIERRGLVTGVLTAATASGQLLFLQFMARLEQGGGWRTVTNLVGFAALAAIPLAAFVLRNRPEDVGTTAVGAPPGYVTPESPPNPIRTAFHGLSEISRQGGFWLLFGGFLVCGVSTNGLIGTHFISAGADHGVDPIRAATLLSFIGIFDIVGTIASGWLTDRYDPRLLLAAYYGLRGVSLFVLDPSFVHGGGPLWAFMLFYGLDWVATVPPTIKLCLEVCGDEYGTIAYGWVYAGHQIGAALMAWGAGYLRDVTGTYQPAYIIAAVCCMIAAAGSMRIGTEDHRRGALTGRLTPDVSASSQS